MVAFDVVVLHELAHDGAQVPLAERDNVPEALVLNRANEPLGVGVEVRAVGRQAQQMYARGLQQGPEMRRMCVAGRRPFRRSSRAAGPEAVTYPPLRDNLRTLLSEVRCDCGRRGGYDWRGGRYRRDLASRRDGLGSRCGSAAISRHERGEGDDLLEHTDAGRARRGGRGGGRSIQCLYKRRTGGGRSGRRGVVGHRVDGKSRRSGATRTRR